MIGTQIGGYRVVEKLAQGGQGAVYIARHELMNREAVIKVLLPSISADPEMVRRFHNEARAANDIQHPGIVEIFDMGFLPSGEAYTAMERLRGESLASRIKRGPLSTAEVLRLVHQLAAALGAAHDHGIVHRDLKPENLFLCNDKSVKDAIVDGGERLKILDFGIAKLGGSKDVEDGTIFGTPAYMSPEQCENAGEVDVRSDLYAVGCIVYEALTGAPPFGRGGLELIAMHARDTPAKPSSVVPSLIPAIDDAVMRLLEKDPAKRAQTCAAMVELFDAAAPNTPATAAPTLAVAPLPPPRRSRTGIWIAAAAVLVVAAVAVGFVVTRSKPTAAAKPAPEPQAMAVVVDARTPDAAPPPPDAAPPPPDAAPPPAIIDATPSLLPVEPPREGVTAVFVERAARIDECARRYAITGRVVLNIQIRPDGWVNAVNVVDSLDPDLSSCLSRIVDTAHFPESQRGGTVSYPLEL